MKNEDLFKQNLIALGEVFDKEISPAIARIYWTSLSEFSDEEVQLAINQAVNTLKFFPKPVELRDFITGNVTERAHEAWEQIMKDIRRGVGGHPEILRGGDVVDVEPMVCDELKNLVAQFGGWSRLRDMSFRELDFMKKDFVKVYSAKSERGLVPRIEIVSPLRLGNE